MHLSVFYASAALVPLVLGQKDPGYPVKNPSISFWQLPAHPDVADHQSEKLPESADVVIIGSGVAGTSVAWHLLMEHKNNSTTKMPKVAMLEARQACSGATGRNGGHIRPSTYEDYEVNKQFTTKEEAAKIAKLRVHHVDALIRAANKLPEAARKASSVREVDSLDVFFEEDKWARALEQYETLKKEIPEIAAEFGRLDREEARRISLMPNAVGALSGTGKVAGAIWGYRFITNSLKMLLDTYPSLSLDTNTTAMEVKALKGSTHNFEVTTSRGSILTNHVVHASNSWAPHFVPILGNTLGGGILATSAQLGGAGLPKAGEWPAYQNVSLPGGRAWSIFANGGLDYIVQNPEFGEYIVGGGAGISQTDKASDLSPYDDSGFPARPLAAYLNGALSSYFGYDNWGAERTDYPTNLHKDIYQGRTKRTWTGIEGFTADQLPLVGPLSTQQTQRAVANPAAGKEWVTAGYNGEGMTYAWLSGKALSQMLQSHQANKTTDEALFEWFPKAFLPSDARLQKQNTTATRRSITRRG
ncbi:ADP-ribosylation factor GTPase-activating protein GCS1 [Apiospora arundinis]|uniref:FAD dependent oxidoreductase-domain-containing protein n=1 Tax=Apiospora arundinis TaxID=335852 RepID=A0ABR2IW77_9PEZI